MSEAAAAATLQASKAMGVVVQLEPAEFMEILRREQTPLVVCALGGLFKKNYQYLTSYKGLAFFTKAQAPIEVPSSTELVEAKSIWIPYG